MEAAQRLNGANAEARRWELEIAKLNDKNAAMPERIQQLTAQSQQLVEKALWASQPGGWLNRDEYAQIRRVLLTWLRDNTGHAELLALRAIARANARQFEEAVNDSENAEHLNRTSPLCIGAQGYVLARSGNPTAGISDLNRAIRRDSKNAPLYRRVLRCICCEVSPISRLGKATMRTRISKSAQLAPLEPWGHCYLAIQCAATRNERLRDGKKAIEHAERACQLTNRRAWNCLDALAAAYAEEGRFTRPSRRNSRPSSSPRRIASPAVRTDWGCTKRAFPSGSDELRPGSSRRGS